MKQATGDMKDYYIFSSLRNPLDIVVSKYFKYKTDHVGAYSQQRLKKFGKVHKYFLYWTDRQRYKFISDGDANFADFFKKFYKLPYSSWAILDHDKMDDIIRYENLQDDFSRVIGELGLDLVRELPGRNVTGGKKKAFWEYYDSPELKARARKLFSPYMEDFQYDWPEEFKQYPAGSRASYNRVNSLRRIYWRNLR
jgi:hypothetical protein